MDESQGNGFKPPYMSFQTFWNFLADLCAKPLPPKLDRSIMSNKSGTDQNNLMAALEAFHLIDENGEVWGDLQTFQDCGPEDRKDILRGLIYKYYQPPLEVSEANGTPNDLNNVFRDKMGISAGDTRRKAITFFLHAAQEAGIPLSPHFPKTRTGSGAPGTPKKRTTTKRKPKDQTLANPAAPSGRGHSQTVNLKSGGTVTLTYDVDLFAVDDDDEAFVLGLVKKLRRYTSVDDDSLDESSNQDEDDE